MYFRLGFRLNAPVVKVRNVSLRIACVDECFAHQCCRSMNYNYATLADHSNKCELLHNLVENTSYVLERNSSFDHLFFNEPLKVIRLLFNFKFSCMKSVHAVLISVYPKDCSSFGNGLASVLNLCMYKKVNYHPHALSSKDYYN